MLMFLVSLYRVCLGRFLRLVAEVGVVFLREFRGEEVLRDLREEDVGEDVFGLGAPYADFLLRLLDFGRDFFAGATGDRLLVAEDYLLYLGVDGGRGLSVVAAEVLAHFVGDHLPALAGDDVHRGLRSDYLAGRRDERRIAHFLADARHFFEHFVELVEAAAFLELALEVGVHSARYLVEQDVDVDSADSHDDVFVFFAELLVVLRYREELFEREPRVERAARESGYHCFGGGLAGAHREGRYGAVYDVGSGFEGREVCHGRHAAGVVAVYLYRKVYFFAYRLNERGGSGGREKPSHVFDAYRVRAHVGHVFRLLCEEVERVDGGDRVGYGHLELAALFFDCFGGYRHVAEVVESVEYADDVYSVADGAFYEFAYGLVRVVAVADEVLPAEEHLGLRLLEALLELAQPLPRVFVEEAHCGVERSAAPAFYGVVAYFIHGLAYRQHVLGAEARRHYGLVRVAECRLGYSDAGFFLRFDGFFHFLHGNGRSFRRRGLFCLYGFRGGYLRGYNVSVSVFDFLLHHCF